MSFSPIFNVNGMKNRDQKLADKWGVCLRTIQRWRAAGAPLESQAAMFNWLRVQNPKSVVTVTLRKEAAREILSFFRRRQAGAAGGNNPKNQPAER
jgi:hypothetical protein